MRSFADLSFCSSSRFPGYSTAFLLSSVRFESCFIATRPRSALLMTRFASPPLLPAQMATQVPQNKLELSLKESYDENQGRVVVIKGVPMPSFLFVPIPLRRATRKRKATSSS